MTGRWKRDEESGCAIKMAKCQAFCFLVGHAISHETQHLGPTRSALCQASFQVYFSLVVPSLHKSTIYSTPADATAPAITRTMQTRSTPATRKLPTEQQKSIF